MNYTIENELLTLTVSEHGAELCDLRRKIDPDGSKLLWDAGEVWQRHAPVCFPWCGKPEGGRIEAGGEVYENVPQHGFVRDHDHTLVSQAPASLTFRFDWPGEAPYPWAFSFETVHTLVGNTVVTTCTAVNRSASPMPVQLGFHCALMCPFTPGRALEDYCIRFEKPEAPEAGDAFPLNSHSFDNDSICFPGLKSEWLQVEERDTGKFLRIATGGFPYTLIWSKVGVPGFVCIEPWSGYVGPGHDLSKRPGALLLPPGESFSRTHRLTVGL